MWPVVVLLFSLSVCIIAHWVYNWKHPKCNGKLPPGSMGLPIIGETLQFFTPYTTRGVSPFIQQRIDRYGSLFRTSLVGWPMVVSTDPEINRFIFQQEGKLFKSWYTNSLDNIVGQENVLTTPLGSLHKYLRNQILSLFGSENLKKRLLFDVAEVTHKRLELWSGQASVDMKESIAAMIFDFTVGKLFGYNEVEGKSYENLKESYADFLDGLISFPLNFPGFAYWKCLQGRKKAMKTLKNILDERRASPLRREDDFLDVLVQELKKDGTILNERIALDLLFALPFATYETASSALTLAMQFLHDHPLALAELTREHEAILRDREKMESGITWKEYKSMTFTFMVINETVRLANIVPGIFRKTLKDVNLKGYTIPSGWIVMVCPTAAHMNPAVYKDPVAFNPWRWKGQEMDAGSHNFMAFGGGARLCAGSEFVKLVMAIFLHQLVTKYRWKVIKGGDTVRQPGLVFPNGLHVQILKKNK